MKILSPFFYFKSQLHLNPLKTVISINDNQSCWVWLCKLLTAQGWKVSGSWCPVCNLFINWMDLERGALFFNLPRRLHELAVALKNNSKKQSKLVVKKKKSWQKILLNALPPAHCRHCCLEVFSVIFFFFWLCCVACGVLVPWPVIKLVPLALGAQSLNHWITMVIPPWDFLNYRNKTHFYKQIQITK